MLECWIAQKNLQEEFQGGSLLFGPDSISVREKRHRSGSGEENSGYGARYQRRGSHRFVAVFAFLCQDFRQKLKVVKKTF